MDRQFSIFLSRLKFPGIISKIFDNRKSSIAFAWLCQPHECQLFVYIVIWFVHHMISHHQVEGRHYQHIRNSRVGSKTTNFDRENVYFFQYRYQYQYRNWLASTDTVTKLFRYSQFFLVRKYIFPVIINIFPIIIDIVKKHSSTEINIFACPDLSLSHYRHYFATRTSSGTEIISVLKNLVPHMLTVLTWSLMKITWSCPKFVLWTGFLKLKIFKKDISA